MMSKGNVKQEGLILQRFKEEFHRLNGDIGVMDLESILNEAIKDFYAIWNEAYGSAAQQAIDIYNK